jgi:arylsulfatase
VYAPGDAAVGEWQAVNTRNRSFVIEAVADLPSADAQGVLFAMGTRFGGHALYVKDRRLRYVNSFVGAEEQMIVGSEDIPMGEDVILSASFEKDGQEPTYATGILSLYHGDTKVGEGRIKTQLGFYAIAGSALYVGRQPGEPVTDDYPNGSPHEFTGGTLKLVAVNVSGKPFTDLEHHAAMLMQHQ